MQMLKGSQVTKMPEPPYDLTVKASLRHESNRPLPAVVSKNVSFSNQAQLSSQAVADHKIPLLDGRATRHENSELIQRKIMKTITKEGEVYSRHQNDHIKIN